jgi:hypothetical protein
MAGTCSPPQAEAFAVSIFSSARDIRPASHNVELRTKIQYSRRKPYQTGAGGRASPLSILFALMLVVRLELPTEYRVHVPQERSCVSTL